MYHNDYSFSTKQMKTLKQALGTIKSKLITPPQVKSVQTPQRYGIKNILSSQFKVFKTGIYSSRIYLMCSA